MKLKSLKTNPTSSRFLTFSCVSIIIHPVSWFYVWPVVPAAGLFFCLCRFLKPLFSGLFEIGPHFLALLISHRTGLSIWVLSVTICVQRTVFDLTPIRFTAISARTFNALCTNRFNRLSVLCSSILFLLFKLYFNSIRTLLTCLPVYPLPPLPWAGPQVRILCGGLP